jgi:hypothetical protein
MTLSCFRPVSWRAGNGFVAVSSGTKRSRVPGSFETRQHGLARCPMSSATAGRRSTRTQPGLPDPEGWRCGASVPRTSDGLGREPMASRRAKGPWGGPCKGGPPFAAGAKFREERRTRDGNHSVRLIRLLRDVPQFTQWGIKVFAGSRLTRLMSDTMKDGSAHALNAVEKPALIVLGITEIEDSESDQGSQEKSHFIFSPY